MTQFEQFYLKQLPLEPLDKPTWKGSYGAKSRWDILVALRGPDWSSPYSGALKWLTTAVIRRKMWKLAKPSGGSAVVNNSHNFITIPYSYSKAGLSWGGFDIQHFMDHVREAAELLGIPYLAIDKDFGLLLQGNPKPLFDVAWKVKNATTPNSYSPFLVDYSQIINWADPKVQEIISNAGQNQSK